MRKTVKAVVGTAVLGLLASLAVIGMPTQPKQAAATPWVPGGQINVYLSEGRVYGYFVDGATSSAAFWTCLAANGGSIYSVWFTDCYAMLAYFGSAYANRVMFIGLLEGQGTMFSWNNANQYLGYAYG